jgi:peptidoglycan/xylan/chitin deacetylase (PgdA/CDA1 family)
MVLPWTFSPTLLFASKWSILKPAAKIGLQHKEVMLTFDDGPNGLFNITDRLLDVLKHEGVPGTFCVIGNHAQAHPDLIQRIYQEGHTIAFHGMYHMPPGGQVSRK